MPLDHERRPPVPVTRPPARCALPHHLLQTVLVIPAPGRYVHVLRARAQVQSEEICDMCKVFMYEQV